MLPSRAGYNQRPLAAAASVQTRTLAANGGGEQTTAHTAAAGEEICTNNCIILIHGLYAPLNKLNCCHGNGKNVSLAALFILIYKHVFNERK